MSSTAAKKKLGTREDGEAVVGAPLKNTQQLADFGLLAGGISHDLNNFLTSVLGHVSLARECRDEPERLEHHMEQIEVGARRAAELLKQLRRCAGNGGGPDLLDLNTIVREMLDLLQAILSSRVRLEVELMPELPEVTADAVQLRQVIMNLVFNAAEALPPEGGLIRVSTGRTQLDGNEPTLVGSLRYFEPGNFVFLEVNDDGQGMDEKTRVRVFEPFFTTKTDGSGLGLVALRDFARRHAGAIELATAPGRGTTFRVLMRSG